MRALVTGGAGFLGSHLCRRLVREGWSVTAVDNFLTGDEANLADLQSHDRFELVRHDITQPLKIRGSVEAVLHLASPASPPDYLKYPIETMQVGSLGTFHALELARAHKAVFLLASTSEVYGDPEVHPQQEGYWGHVNPIGPRSVYDEAKRYAEALTTAYHRAHRLPIRIARIFNTYGPGMRRSDGRAIPNFITQALRGEPLTVYGDGSQTRSFCYVDDLIEGLMRLMKTDHAEPVNLGDPKEFTILQLAEQVIAATKTRSRIEFRPLPQDDPKQRCPDIRQAQRLLQWSPTVSLTQGLPKTIAWFRQGQSK